MTTLSIVIPTRNRQSYCMDAVKHMLASQRTDFEIVIGDNSDDGSILAEFAAGTSDPRLVYVAPAETPLPMRANWDRLVPATNGRWVSFIGDDDYLDPETAGILALVERKVPDGDAFTWGRTYFSWPDARQGKMTTRIPSNSHLIRTEQRDLMKLYFFWQDATDRPQCSFGVYHGAVRRSLLDSIREAFGGVYFEHPNADYDSIAKTVLMSSGAVYWERPLSVFGACKASNSAGLLDIRASAEITKAFLAENDHPFTAPDFPFSPAIGITASVAGTIEWIKHRYGIVLNGWQDNFIAACARNCENDGDRASFETRREGYREAIRAWAGDKAAKAFSPKFKPSDSVPRFQGFADDHLAIDMDMGGCRTAAEFYALVNSITFPTSHLEFRL